MSKIISFDEALKRTKDITSRHLLLGNGFSIACRSDIFVYKRLLEEADFSKLTPHAREVFDTLRTNDFEKVIQLLANSAKVVDLYGADSASLTQAMLKDAEGLKEVLVQTIAKAHPGHPDDIEQLEYYACGKFLGNFSSIYTLNYDLLLYWTVLAMRELLDLRYEDGFGKPEDEPEADFVIWHSSRSHRGSRIIYLHGALHLFERGNEIEKFTWCNTGIRLIEQIRSALEEGRFPVFVAEGCSDEKLDRIRHNPYLEKARRSFESISGCLFVLGHSFSENDEHYLELIERSKISQLFVGLHGDPSSDSNKHIRSRAERMSTARERLNSSRNTRRRRSAAMPLDVTFFYSSTANVWSYEGCENEYFAVLNQRAVNDFN